MQDFEARYELKSQEWAEKSGPIPDNRNSVEETLKVEEEEPEVENEEQDEPDELAEDDDWVEI